MGEDPEETEEARDIVVTTIQKGTPPPADTAPPAAPIFVVDGQGHSIVPQTYRPPPLAVTDTERWNIVQTLADSLQYGNGMAIVESALSLAASQFQQVTVGRDMPLGSQTCQRCNVVPVPDERLERALKWGMVEVCFLGSSGEPCVG